MFIKKNNVKIDIFNIEGRIVKQILSKIGSQGYHHVSWNGKNEKNQAIASGVYLVKFQTNNIISFSKVLLLK